MGMKVLDINVLPWGEQRQRRWQRQRHWFQTVAFMLIGWIGCGHLWHDSWRNYCAARWLAQQQRIQEQRVHSLREGEQRLAAEQWRRQALNHQQQRVVYERQLATLWRALTAAGVSLRDVNWQPDHWQLVLRNAPHQTMIHVQNALTTPDIIPQCHVVSTSSIRCELMLHAQGEDVHDRAI